MKHLFRRIYEIPIFLSVLCAPLFALGQPGGPENSEERAKRVIQRGVIEINGCIVERKDLKLTATAVPLPQTGREVDLNDDDDDGQHGDDDSQPRDRHALVTDTRNPHIFRFAIHGLSPRRSYSLNLGMHADCGKMTWIGPKRGLIVPVRHKLVRLQGFVLSTQIDVQTTDTTGKIKFLGADAMTSTSAIRIFRWHTDVPGFHSAELQIAIDRFTSSTDTPGTCANPSGLITRMPLAGGAGENFTPPIDFNALIFGSGISAGITPNLQFAVAHGAPLYVRVVPVDDSGTPLCNLLDDGAAAFTVVDFLPLKILPGPIPLSNPSLEISGDYTPAMPVAFGSKCVLTVKFHQLDFFGADLFWDNVFLNAGDVHNNAIGKGVVLCLVPSSPSIFDDIGDFISGVIEGIAVIVDSFAELYDGIKQDVVKLVASAIQELNIDCGPGSLCQDAINVALNTALAAAGLPPSLPNFEELANQGVDYLKEQVADQTGFPQDLVDKAGDIVQQVITDAANAQGGSGGALPDWLVYDNQFRPSLLLLTVARPNNFQPIPDQVLIQSNSGLYPPFNSVVNIPIGMAPASSFTVPVQLWPNLDNTADAPQFCPFGPPSCQSFPMEYVLEFKLRDWFVNAFQTTRCTQFDMEGFHLQTFVGEDLGAHTVFTQAPAHFGPGGSNTCQ